jgi:hypothetical protein
MKSAFKAMVVIGAQTIVAAVLLAMPMIATTAEAQSKKGKVPAAVTIENRRTATLTGLSLYNAGTEDKPVASIPQQVPPGKKTTLKLPKGTLCTVTVSATFDDESEASGDLDVCKDKLIRLNN